MYYIQIDERPLPRAEGLPTPAAFSSETWPAEGDPVAEVDSTAGTVEEDTGPAPSERAVLGHGGKAAALKKRGLRKLTIAISTAAAICLGRLHACYM